MKQNKYKTNVLAYRSGTAGRYCIMLRAYARYAAAAERVWRHWLAVCLFLLVPVRLRAFVSQ